MSSLYTDRQIEDAKIDIVGVVDKYLPLKKGGKNYFAPCPFHQEKSGSFTVNAEKQMYYCLSAETRVITWSGVAEIKSLAGRVNKILTAGGIWVEAPISSYGVQPLMAVNLARNGVKKTIRATPEHEWITKRKASKVRTCDLSPGSYLETCSPERAEFEVSKQGIRHGIVFGDGCVQGGYGHVNLHQGKMSLSAFFVGDFDVKTLPSGKEYIRVYGGKSFSHMKSLPSKKSDNDYLAGFISGYIATDGCVDGRGDVTISSSEKGNLEFFELACLRLGMTCGSISTVMRLGYLDNPGPMHQISIHGESFRPELLIRKDQQERFNIKAQRRPSRSRWKVISVEDIGAREEVFCAYVEGTHSFVLDGGILTGNCFGCGAGGNAIDFVMNYENLSFPDAMEKIIGQLPVGENLAKLRSSIGKAVATSIPGHRQDATKAAENHSKCTSSPTHHYLLMNNTASNTDVLNLGKFLAVELYSAADEMVNLAAIGTDNSIHYAAGGISFGATARLKPEGEHDGMIILARDYDEAWRIWWRKKGNSEVRATLSADNFIYMTRRCRDQFTHVACSADEVEEFEEMGIATVLTQPAYSRMIA